MAAHVAPRRNGNLVKGVLAAGAAAALGLGLFSANGGSFALWSDSATLGNATMLHTGHLRLTTGEGSWRVDPAGRPGKDLVKPGEHRVVPGDKLVYTQKVTLETLGENLRAELDVEVPNVIAQPGNEELAEALQVTITASSASGQSVTRTNRQTGDTLGGALQLLQSETPDLFNQEVTVTLSVTLPPRAMNETQNMSVRLEPATVTATQVLPSNEA